MQYMAKDACPEKKESLENTEIRVRAGRKDILHPHMKLQQGSPDAVVLVTAVTWTRPP